MFSHGRSPALLLQYEPIATKGSRSTLPDLKILVLTERVENTITLGESHFREFKTAHSGPPEAKRPRNVTEMCREIGEALVAFANADGGDLLIGVEDDGEITGVPHGEEELARLLEAPRTHVHQDTVLPLQYATALTVYSKEVLFFSVGKGSNGVFQLPDGRCVRRRGTSTVPATVRNLLFDQREARSRAFDGEFVDGAKATDLDLSLLRGIADEYLRGITPEKYLQQTGLAEYVAGGLRLRRAALLLFAKDVRVWHPRCQVRIIKVEGTSLGSGRDYNVTSDELVEGNILELLVKSWESLRPFLAYKTEFGPDTRFEQKYIYPEWACREALINSLTHRDYSMQDSVDVYIYDDRMDIKSPGPLLSTLTIEQLLRLKGAHESRNALVAKVLRENGYVRELGEGMKRIFQLMQESDLQIPDLQTDGAFFTVTLYHRSVFSPEQVRWLSLFEDMQLSRLEQRIVAAGMEGRELSPDDIYNAMNTRDRDTYDRTVTMLRTKQVLVEIRSNVKAQRMAIRTGQRKTAIPRFKVVLPTSSGVQQTARPKIAIFGLPLTASKTDLAEFLTQFGEVVRIDLPKMDPEAVSRFGFASFAPGTEISKLFDEPVVFGNSVLRIEPGRTTDE